MKFFTKKQVEDLEQQSLKARYVTLSAEDFAYFLHCWRMLRLTGKAVNGMEDKINALLDGEV